MSKAYIRTVSRTQVVFEGKVLITFDSPEEARPWAEGFNNGLEKVTPAAPEPKRVPRRVISAGSARRPPEFKRGDLVVCSSNHREAKGSWASKIHSYVSTGSTYDGGECIKPIHAPQGANWCDDPKTLKVKCDGARYAHTWDPVECRNPVVAESVKDEPKKAEKPMGLVYCDSNHKGREFGKHIHTHVREGSEQSKDQGACVNPVKAPEGANWGDKYNVQITCDTAERPHEWRPNLCRNPRVVRA